MIESINTKNLALLRDWIAQNIEPEQFDMCQWRSDKKVGLRYYRSRTNCGTIGCAMGWGPFVPELEPENWMISDGTLDFDLYSLHYFNINRHEDPDDFNYSWDFIFSWRWKRHNNTINGFLCRADYVLENGKAPLFWNYKDWAIRVNDFQNNSTR